MISSKPRLVVVTGLSGAGRSTAVNALEDLGFFCVDNLPPPVVAPSLLALFTSGVSRVALGIDVRVGTFFAEAPGIIDTLGQTGTTELSVLFLDAADEALLRRFGSTRRPHPLSSNTDVGEQTGPHAVLDGIRLERSRLAPLRARATVVIDTTNLSVHELRRRIVDYFGPGTHQQPNMRTRVISFGFKYGAPVDADLILDVRFLPNPYFVETLKDQVGTDIAVRDYVVGSPDGAEFLKRALELLSFCLPRYEKEGKSYLTIAIGCTGGRHRSVAMAEAIATALQQANHAPIRVTHRDIAKDNELIRNETDVLGGGPRGRGVP